MKLIFIIFSLITIGGCSNHSTSKEETESLVKITNDRNTKSEGAHLYIKKEKYDFGTINEKDTQVLLFDVEIENTGNSPLTILKADVSCGCITVKYPQEPIRSNRKGIVHVKVDTRGKKGYFNKTVFLKTNAINDVELIRIKGRIE